MPSMKLLKLNDVFLESQSHKINYLKWFGKLCGQVFKEIDKDSYKGNYLVYGIDGNVDSYDPKWFDWYEIEMMEII